MRILIIDDERDVRDIVAACLPDDQVIAAPRASDALRIAKRERPELILLDMAGAGDGEETLKSLARDPQLARIPVVLLSGVGESENFERMKLLGARGLVTKPIRAATFADDVRRAAAGDVITHRGGSAVLDDDAIAALRGLQNDADPTFFSDLVTEFVSETSKRLAKIRSDLDRRELAQAAPDARHIAGSCGNIGADAMARLASGLESSLKHGDRTAANAAFAALNRHFEEARAILLRLADA